MKRAWILIAVLAITTAACASAPDQTGADESVPATTSTGAPTTTMPREPTTTAAPTTTSGPSPTSQEDIDEITALYTVVFSSDTAFLDKAHLIDDSTGLEETIAKYTETGTSMGGVGLEATKIVVVGDSAEVTYDLLFAGTPTYPDLAGAAIRVDGTWIVTRDMFCSIMTSARVGCPSS